MTSTDFKSSRLSLGLTRRELAGVLGITYDHVRAMEKAPGTAGARVVTGRTARDMQRLVGGYRPPEWPKSSGIT